MGYTDNSNPFRAALTDAQRMAVAAAVLSGRWETHIFSAAFGINVRTIKTIRSGRHGKYAKVHEIVNAIGKDAFVEHYLDEETAQILNTAHSGYRLRKSGRS